MITLEGCITTFEVIPASVDDRKGLWDLVENQSGMAILEDKGYPGDDMRRQGMCLMSLKPSNYKKLASGNTASHFLLSRQGGNSILTAWRAAECRKSTCEKLLGIMYPTVEQSIGT